MLNITTSKQLQAATALQLEGAIVTVGKSRWDGKKFEMLVTFPGSAVIAYSIATKTLHELLAYVSRDLKSLQAKLAAQLTAVAAVLPTTDAVVVFPQLDGTRSAIRALNQSRPAGQQLRRNLERFPARAYCSEYVIRDERGTIVATGRDEVEIESNLLDLLHATA